ncbi:MAG: prepilin-type N-terminal cleavage/methylation domain-containing protein [Phycisphaerae bacterium]|nr:prepilin-type N-terminal cleavage/methylation domain-containing protein [Phycisphaerae bacterium]
MNRDRTLSIRMCGSGLSGFTLIELLVVVAIIAVLVSILLPALTSARQSAQSVACGSNLSQIGRGLFMFGDENDGLIPMGEYLGGKWEIWWPVSVLSMMGPVVPETTANRGMWGGYLACPTAEAEFGASICFSYALNCTLHDLPADRPDPVSGATGFQWRTGRIGEIVYPSRSPAVMDTWQRRGQDYSYPPYAQFFHPFNLQGNPPPRHGGGHSSDQATFNSATVYAGDGYFNIVYFDGHVGRESYVPASWRGTTRDTVY